MSTDKIKKLIEAFYKGETSTQEELDLLEYFNCENVAEELLNEKEFFIELYNAQSIEVPAMLESNLSNLIDTFAQEKGIKPKKNKKYLLVWFSSVAASIALLISIGLYLNNKPSIKDTQIAEKGIELKDTFTNPDDAYIEAQRALTLVSSNFNKGMNQLAVVSVNFDKTNEILNKSLNRKKNKES